MKPKKDSVPSTRDEAIDLLAQIRAETITLRRLQLEREREIKKIDDGYLPRIETIQERVNSLADQLEAWASAHPGEFGDAKSIECLHGRFGYRICPPAAKPIRPFTWAKILECMENSDEFSRFIRIKKEVDKEALIAARAEIPPEKLRKIGVKIEQLEIFFIDPKLDDDLQ